MNYNNKTASTYGIYPLTDVLGNNLTDNFNEGYHYSEEPYSRLSSQQPCEIECHSAISSMHMSYGGTPDHISSQNSEGFPIDCHIHGTDNQSKKCTIWDCQNCGIGKVTEGNGCSTAGCEGSRRPAKRRNTANKKERRRTQSINNAFTELRDCIPNVPSDTKLSKQLFFIAFYYRYYCLENKNTHL